VSALDRRIGLLFAVFLCLLGIGLARALYLATVKGNSLAQAAATQQVRNEVILARRGSIVDRHGFELAVSEPAADVSANPRLITDPARIAAKILPFLDITTEDLLKKLVARDTGFIYLKRKVPGPKADRIKALKLEGINVDAAEQRTYPKRFLASQVIGRVGLDGQGQSGVEYARDRALRGRAGRRRQVKDAHGQTLSVADPAPAVPGKRVELTLDAAVQKRTEDVLARLGAKYRPKGASAIVLDPRTNEVLAMANWPKVDAQNWDGAPATAQQNKATGYTYEPGSTFKAFTVAAALQEGLVTPYTTFNLGSTIQVADREIANAHARGPATLSTAQILAQSDNVGAITVGLRLGQRKFDRWVRKFGFGKPTGIDLPGEERGIQPPVSKYSGSSMGNLPIGQGESVTPIQMATAYSAIANGGILRPAQMVRRVGGKLVHRSRGTRILSESVAAQVRTMLEGVLAPGGTAQEVKIPGYKLAGKTGTANKVDASTGEYSESRYVASFVGFAPARNPRLLVSIMVDEPQGSIYGGQVAAPAFGEIAAFALQYLRIPPK
jgi:cell division protein FtsI (penicillin-binding protein 3)